ncbi:MAG: glutaminyl-peptide cyclotransferase [Sphingobacteriales bacterium]|nr:glutaminyl-peptide cyclotransferase [Sphingobacteriales bacterium]
MKKTFTFTLTILLALLLGSCKNTDEQKEEESGPAIPLINYAVKRTYLHDTTSFTEGLLFHDSLLYESTGAQPGLESTRSLFGVLSLKTGRIDVKAELDRKKYFGEGIVFFGNKVYQLTYTTQKGFIYDAKTFRPLGEFSFPNKEGWGFTTDSTYLIMSDGTSQLTYFYPDSLTVKQTIAVSDTRNPVDKLNELEFINGFIYANIYTTSDIVKIDPASGNIVGRLDLSSLVNEVHQMYPASLEMNGIAYNPATGSIFVTGKMWPVVYEITFPF